jgi:hypothetical protein
MPFCPTCKAEYREGVTQCHDCGVALVERLPEERNEDFEVCSNCSEHVTPDSDFCVHCGAMFSNDNYWCEKHPTLNAAAVCVICRRLLCHDCSVRRGVRMFCEDHKNVEISEDWVVAFQSVDYFEANIVRGKLESAGITVNPRNNTSIGFIADGFIESAIGRSILRYPVKVFVPLDQYLQAVEVIKDEFPPET